MEVCGLLYVYFENVRSSPPPPQKQGYLKEKYEKEEGKRGG